MSCKKFEEMDFKDFQQSRIKTKYMKCTLVKVETKMKGL